MALLLGVVYLIIIGCIIVSMAVLLLKGRRTRYNDLCAACQASTVLWCVSQIMLLLSTDIRQLWISYLIGNLGICFVGSFWLLFVLSYSAPPHELPRWWPLPIIVSAFHFLCVATNGMHHLYYKEFAPGRVEHGVFFYTNVIYIYLCVLVGAVILYRCEEIQKHRRSGRAKRFLVLAALVPIVLNSIQLSGIVGHTYDITPLGFGISTILVLLATIRYRFLEVNVMAFESVIYGLSDGVIIFEGEKMTYSNPAFWQLLSEKERELGHAQWRAAMQQIQDSRKEKQPFLEIQTYCPREKTQIYVLKDVSEYYQLLEKEKELAVSREQYALSQDRNRIAQQVHDTTGHTLVMIQSLLKLALLEENRDYIEQARQLSQTGLRELRESINRLRQEENAPLVSLAVRQLTDQVREIEVEVTIQGEDDEKYSYLTGVIYATLRETITNCLKYADAGRLEVVVRFQPDKIEMIMADDGKGCSRIVDNHGLRGIRERIEARNGTVRFSSGEGEGFMTRVVLPVE